MPLRDELSEINQQLAPTLVSRPSSFSQDAITVEDQYADFYYKHFGETIGHQPPEPDNLMPWRDQLSEINQQLAPTFTLTSRQASASRESGEQDCFY